MACSAANSFQYRTLFSRGFQVDASSPADRSPVPAALTDDNEVNHRNSRELAGLAERLVDLLVFSTRFRLATRMVVHQDNPGRVIQGRALVHLPWADQCRVDGAD